MGNETTQTTPQPIKEMRAHVFMEDPSDHIFAAQYAIQPEGVIITTTQQIGKAVPAGTTLFIPHSRYKFLMIYELGNDPNLGGIEPIRLNGEEIKAPAPENATNEAPNVEKLTGDQLVPAVARDIWGKDQETAQTATSTTKQESVG